jgi:hypothetical protein
MSKNAIEHPFEIKKDPVTGKVIPPDFLESTVSGPTVAPVGQLSISPPVASDVQSESVEPEPYAEESSEEVSQVAQSEIPQKVDESDPQQKRSSPPKEHNLRRLREELERERAERDIMARELEILRRVGVNNQQVAQSRYQPQEQVEEIQDLNIGDDDLVEGKHLKQYVQQMQKQLKTNAYQYQQHMQQASQAALEIQLKAQYPDFDQVVNQGNLKDLAAAYPELAATIHSSPDLRSQAVTAYTMIKNLGIDQVQDQSQGDQYMADKERIKKNAAKPRPASSAAPTHSSPLSKASAFSGDLTPALKAQLVREMEEFRRR